MSAVRVLSLDVVVVVESGRGVLIVIREVWLLVKMEEERVLRTVPDATMFLVDWKVDMTLYGDF